ncbi:MAG: GNAT family N-acetyltransferase [Nitrosopumilaceae archaeon]
MSLDDMILKIEENDSGFTSTWAKVTRLDCADLFSNPRLSGDPFFNKLTNITRISEKVIDQAVSIFQNQGQRVFVYVLDNPKLEDYLSEKGFSYYDTLHVFRISNVSSGDFSIRKISSKDSMLWTEIFCSAYDCAEWSEEVNNIVKNSISQVNYFVDSDYSASCVALYERNSILGLYCLGTKPEKRKKRLASLHVDHALNILKQNRMRFLMLESFGRDNLLEFYSKLGFEKIYEKRIFAI